MISPLISRTKVQQWASRFIPSPADNNLIKNRLLDGEIVKVLTPVRVEVELTRYRQERVTKHGLQQTFRKYQLHRDQELFDKACGYIGSITERKAP